jgi:hypothetical protein
MAHPARRNNTLTAHIVSAVTGANFAMYLADMQQDGSAYKTIPGVERWAPAPLPPATAAHASSRHAIPSVAAMLGMPRGLRTWAWAPCVTCHSWKGSL